MKYWSIACCTAVLSIGCGSSGGASGSSAAGASGTTNATGGASGASGGASATAGSSGASSALGGSSGSSSSAAGSGALAGAGGATAAGGGTAGAAQGGATSVVACSGVKPDATNTGVPPGTQLTVVNSDVTITKDNTTLDAEDVHGFVIVKASHVTISRSIVRGGVATQNGDGIQVASGTDILIQDVEVNLEHPSAFLDGISGSNFTVLRANIHGGVDGMKVGSNSIVECSYIHDMVSFASDPNQGGGPTHNDAIQILSGSMIQITGNQLVAAMDQNSAIQVTQDFGLVSDLVIDSNWADGGGCSFNFAHKGGDSLAVTANNNRFGRNSSFGCPILKSTKTTLTAMGNVYDDDGTPVLVQTHD